MLDSTAEYVTVEVTRTQTATVTIKRLKGQQLPDDVIVKALNAQGNTVYWDTDDWENTIEVQSVETVSPEEARQYVIYDATVEV